MWLENSRGHFVDSLTQRWVQATGRTVSLDEHPWLAGPSGRPRRIGAECFDEYAAQHGLRVLRGQPAGLCPSLDVLRCASFEPRAISPAVADFYTRTSEYDVDAWSEWSGAFRPFGRTLAALFSRRLQQLNVPLSNLDTSHGLTSDVFPLVAGETGVPVMTAWVRQMRGSGHVLYAGAYSTCVVPDQATPCVKVVFPLPNGNAMVLMRPTSHPDGSLRLTSAGSGFGSPGFYFTLRRADGTVWARYLRGLRESIHVYEADGVVRADHELSLWRRQFLRLHYRLRSRTHLEGSTGYSTTTGGAVAAGRPGDA